jgi:type III pantothenate kinase
MLLASDIGNTQTALGIFRESDTPVYASRIATSPSQTPDELRVLIHALFALYDIDFRALDHLIIGSVVPAQTENWIRLGEALGIGKITVVSSRECGGLDIDLDVPSEAGADRLANAIGAKTRYGAPSIVVDFGTATNIDVISAQGAYQGGVISPGLETSASALFSHAARLSAVDLIAPAHVIGTSTKSAVQSGLIYGEAAKVDGLVKAVIAELGVQEHLGDHAERPVVIATGGLVEILAPLCSTIDHIDAELTLYGRWCIAQSG